MDRPYGQNEHGEGSRIVASCSVVLIWGLIIFLQWQDSMLAHDIGDFDASYRRYGVMLLTTLFAIVSTFAVRVTVTWLKHKRGEAWWTRQAGESGACRHLHCIDVATVEIFGFQTRPTRFM